MGYNEKMKKRMLWTILGIVALVVAVGVGVWLLVRGGTSVELEGWIDCSLPMSEENAKLCEEAERQNYPYIAY